MRFANNSTLCVWLNWQTPEGAQISTFVLSFFDYIIELILLTRATNPNTTDLIKTKPKVTSLIKYANGM